MRIQNKKGVVLTIALIVTLMVALIAGYVMTLAYNQKKLSDELAGIRTSAYYRAQAGVVDAQWRLRVNSVALPGGARLGGAGAGTQDFTNPDFDPYAYSFDIDGDGVNDVTVDIGAVERTDGFRRIHSMGRD